MFLYNYFIKAYLRNSLHVSSQHTHTYFFMTEGFLEMCENMKSSQIFYRDPKKSPLDLVQPWGLQEVVAAMFSCFVVDSL